MNQHIDTSRVNHEIAILSTVKELKQKGGEKDLENEELKKKNDEKDTSLNELKRDFEDLKKEFDQLTTKIENNEKERTTCYEEVKENQAQQSNKIDDLETFADRCSKIHFTLSEKEFQRNHQHQSTLFQQDYDKNKNVKEWNKIVEEVNKQNSECPYLGKLKDSVNQYQETVYSPTYQQRLMNLCYFIPAMTIHGDFIKIGCHYGTEHICVKFNLNLAEFTKEIEKVDRQKTRKVQNSNVCSFYIGDCLHVVLYGYCPKLYLLHESSEIRKLDLPQGKPVKLEDTNFNYIVDDSVVLYLG